MPVLPRRALVAIASTAVAVVLLLDFSTPAAPTAPLAAIVSGASAPAAQAGPAGQPAAPGSSPGSSGPSGASAGSGGSTSAGSTLTGSTSAPAPTQATTGTAASYRAGTYRGPAVQIQFGTVQVQVTISGGRITQVQELRMPTLHARSARISQIVAPLLEQEVLQAQSAQINAVSGATYTSEAYAQSIQGALDQAHA